MDNRTPAGFILGLSAVLVNFILVCVAPSHVGNVMSGAALFGLHLTLVVMAPQLPSPFGRKQMALVNAMGFSASALFWGAVGWLVAGTSPLVAIVPFLLLAGIIAVGGVASHDDDDDAWD